MNRLYLEESWPDSWKYSYPYDLQEIWGQVTNKGYAYAYSNRRHHTLQLLKEVLPDGGKILDVAAAQGNFSLTMAEMGYEVTWNDLREDLADYVKKKFEKGKIDYAPGNVFELGFSEQFDAVLITEIIEHVAHPDEFLSQIGKMVKPGGYVIMSTPNGGYFRNALPKFSDCPDPSEFESKQFEPNSDGHIFLLWPEEVKWLAEESGLILEKHVLFSNSLTAGHIKLEYLLKILPKALVDFIEESLQKLPSGFKKKLMTGSASRFKKS